MNAINVDIVRSPFMPLFLGGTLAAAALAVMAILRWGEPGAMVMLAGGELYVRPERDSHARYENRTATDTCRRCKRRIGGCWRSQPYTESHSPTFGHVAFDTPELHT